MRIVLIVWEDASQVDEGVWVDRKTAPEAEQIVFHQVGFLQSLTATELVLTATIGEHAMGARDRIPTGMVKSITELVGGKAIRIPRKRRK